MTSSSPPLPQEFDYPPARVDQSIEGLDLNTLIMRSHAPPTQELNPLEASTYEVVPLDDSIYEISDDDGHTASVASTTPDDESTFDETDDDDFEQEFVEEPTPELESAAAEASDNHMLSGGHDSTLTETPNMDESESSSVIRLEEEPGTEHDGIEAWALSKEFTQAQISGGVLNAYGCSDLRLTVRATLSERHYPVRGSFKVLYIGNIENWDKKDIESRVHAALNASPGPSRSVMMRGQMEPYSTVINGYQSSSIEVLEDAGKKTGVIVKLKEGDGYDLVVGTQKALSNPDASRLPDLVVFWYPQPTLPTSQVDEFPAAREAFRRHHIPCLHISTDRRFHHHSDGFADNKSLRTCVEGRDDDKSDFKQQETIPVDVFTFLNLDPSQLNRHLAALAPPVAASSPDPVRLSERWGLRKLWGNTMTSFKETVAGTSQLSPNTKKMLLAFATLITMTSLYLLSATLVPQYLPQPLGRSTPKMVGVPPANINTQTWLASSIPAPPASISQPVVSSAPPAPIKSAAFGLTTVPSSQQPSQQKQERKMIEKAGGFEIIVTREDVFLLRPSKDFINRKRKPQLQIQVSKNGKSVPIQYTRSSEGTYLVHLEQQYPVGPFNVSIATHSKPLMQQSFAITLGHNKTGFAHLFDTVWNEIAITQQGFEDMVSSLSKRFQADLTRWESAGNWKDKVGNSRREAADHLQEAKEEAKRQFAAGASFLRNIPGDTWMGLRKVTAPARTSPVTLRARNNAFRIRCGFERALGLSSREDEEKKTRSCKKVGW
jgi:hypothetical protein